MTYGSGIRGPRLELLRIDILRSDRRSGSGRGAESQARPLRPFRLRLPGLAGQTPGHTPGCPGRPGWPSPADRMTSGSARSQGTRSSPAPDRRSALRISIREMQIRVSSPRSIAYAHFRLQGVLNRFTSGRERAHFSILSFRKLAVCPIRKVGVGKCSGSTRTDSCLHGADFPPYRRRSSNVLSWDV